MRITDEPRKGMRDILFKAKRIDNGEWAEGYLVRFCDRYGGLGFEIIAEAGIYYDGSPNYISHEVDESTICQYIGLTDKNGKKIWENDIVKCQDVIGRIDWNKTHLAYTILASFDGNMQYYFIDEGLSSDIEVIGNTFDNPELLKVGE